MPSGTGSAARFFFPVGLGIDSSGNLYVADTENDTVREVTQAGVVTTLAGTPRVFGTTDGTGAAALFDNPEGIAVDSLGNVYVSDFETNTIRKGTLSGAPQIVAQPSVQFVTVGGSATFSVTATGSSGLSYQWNFNSAAISGATSSSYTVSNAQASNAGSYSVTVTDADGSTTSVAVNLNVSTGAASARLINISTRAMVGTGGNILIPGFAISGPGMETLLIRGDGPSLAQFSVGGLLAQPVLTVFNSAGTQIATKHRMGHEYQHLAVPDREHSTAGGRLRLLGRQRRLRARYHHPARRGASTAQIAGLNGSTGVRRWRKSMRSQRRALASSIFQRAQVGTGGNILIPGFVISGPGTDQLLVRADGPSLTQFSVSGVLAQTMVAVFNAAGTSVASNTGWSTNPDASVIATVASTVGAFSFQANSGDSAEIVSLPSGSYTIQVSGVNNTTGVALAEIYEVVPPVTVPHEHLDPDGRAPVSGSRRPLGIQSRPQRAVLAPKKARFACFLNNFQSVWETAAATVQADARRCRIA